MIHPSRDNARDFAQLRIGLLGGSFNPAHEGHLEMSRFALNRLGLDQVWWLVSPQNPLKSRADMAPLAERLAQASALAAVEPRLIVSDLESQLQSHFTVDLLRFLWKYFSATRFVWLMGADNLAQIPQWRDWEEVFRLVPIAVFSRAGYDVDALVEQWPLQRVAALRRNVDEAPILAEAQPPVWVTLDNPLNALSATKIRDEKKKQINS